MMFSPTTFSAIAYLVFFIFGIAEPVRAHPFSRFTQNIQSRGARHAAHVEHRETRLQRRGLPGAVYICTDRNFRGDCAWIMPDNQCHIPGTGANAPKSIGPDPGGSCVLFKKADCTGNQVLTLRFPGLDWAIPEFGGLKCLADGQGGTGNGTGIVQNGGTVGSGILPAGNSQADPRLAGGTGSAERLKLKQILDGMEEDGFKEGMIGLEKGHYY